MNIILAADHAGYELKEAVKKFLQDKKYSVLDVGAHELKPEDDYPIYMSEAAMHVAKDLKGETRAILFGGSGQGEAIVANRFPGVRAVVWYGGGLLQSKNEADQNDSTKGTDKNIICLSREHNDANILSIGAWFVTKEEAIDAVQSWLATEFSGEEKHARRIALIDSLE